MISCFRGRELIAPTVCLCLHKLRLKFSKHRPTLCRLWFYFFRLASPSTAPVGIKSRCQLDGVKSVETVLWSEHSLWYLRWILEIWASAYGLLQLYHWPAGLMEVQGALDQLVGVLQLSWSTDGRLGLWSQSFQPCIALQLWIQPPPRLRFHHLLV